MLGGKVNLFFDDNEKVSADKNKKYYFMNDKRES